MNQSQALIEAIQAQKTEKTERLLAKQEAMSAASNAEHSDIMTHVAGVLGAYNEVLKTQEALDGVEQALAVVVPLAS